MLLLQILDCKSHSFFCSAAYRIGEREARCREAGSILVRKLCIAGDNENRLFFFFFFFPNCVTTVVQAIAIIGMFDNKHLL